MIDHLKRVPMFSSLNVEQLENLSRLCQRKVFRSGTVLFQEKDPGTVFYILVKGQVKIYTTSNNGEEKVLSVLKEGDNFGELSLLDGKPRSASAATLEECTVYTLTAQDFFTALKGNFDMTLKVLQDLAQRLRDTNQHVHDLTFLDSRTRVIKNLILMANRNGRRVGNTIEIRVALNYDELAKMAGVSKTILMEVIRDFTDKGLLSFATNGFILDLSKIRS